MDDHSHSSAHRLALADPPVARAQEAINLLEKRLAEKFGVRVLMGAELEFGALPKADFPHDYGIEDAAAKEVGPSASLSRSPEQRDPWFPDSRRVAYSYMEDDTANGWQKLECVLTHRPMRKDGTPVARDGVGFARDIEALRHQLHHTAPGYLPPSQDHPVSDNRENAAPWQRMRHEELKELSTRARIINETILDKFEQLPQLPKKKIAKALKEAWESHERAADFTCGMHINSSLEPLHGPSRDGHSDAVICVTGIQRVLSENGYLLGTDVPSLLRWASRSGLYGTVSKRHRSGINYVENAVPSASSNPYYATLLQLAGIYYALDHYAQCGQDMKQFTATNPIDGFSVYQQEKASDIMHGTKQLKQKFKKGTILRTMLNDLRPQLGDEFFAEIAKIPPGQELSMMDKTHYTDASVQR